MIDISNDKARYELFYKIRGAAITVQKNLGPHMVEKFYERALVCELSSLDIKVETQVSVPTFYKGQPMDLTLVADMLVEDEVLIELKATPCVEKSHIRQLLTYMKLMRKHYGLILNFGVTYMVRGGMKSLILSDFDKVYNAADNFEDQVGLVALS